VALASSFAGIWSGETVSSLTGQRIGVNGVALPSGEVMFFAYQDCHVFNGSYTTSGSTLNLTATAQYKNYCQGVTELYPVGWDPKGTSAQYTQTFKATGSFTERGRSTLNYSASLGDSGVVNLAYWDVADRPSALSKLAGSYTNGPGLAVTINDDGTFTGTDRVPNILTYMTRNYSGRFSILDPARNIYGLTITADGKSFHGYAFLVDSAQGKSNDAIQLVAIQASWGPFVHYWIRK
jgi:hypothetical protein